MRRYDLHTPTFQVPPAELVGRVDEDAWVGLSTATYCVALAVGFVLGTVAAALVAWVW